MPSRDWRAYGAAARGGLIGTAAGLLLGLAYLALPLQVAPKGDHQHRAAETQCAAPYEGCEAKLAPAARAKGVANVGQLRAPGEEGEYSEGQKALWKSIWSAVAGFFGSAFFTNATITDVLLALFTGYLALVTRRLWRSTKGLEAESIRQHETMRQSVEQARKASDAAAKSAEAALEANTLSREAMIAAQRPWIHVDISIISPLTWDDEGCRCQFKFTLTNQGQTPALDVRIDAQFYSPDPFFQAPGDQLEFSKTIATVKDRFMGETLFPRRKLTRQYNMIIGNAEIERVKNRYLASHNIEMDYLNPTLIGCANYSFVFGDSRHQTGFIAEIRRQVPINNSVAITRSNGDIPIEHMVFMRGMKDGYTD